MNIIVTGGRRSTDKQSVFRVLDQILWRDGTRDRDIVIVQGGATGIDKFAREWCKMRGVDFKNYPYPKHLGRSGGPIRNRDMAQKEKPAFVVAFAGGKGTLSMMKIAEEMGIAVILAGERPEPMEQKFQPRYLTSPPKGL